MISGIYRIRNTANNKFYIGSAIYLNARKLDHFWRLRHDTHYNKHLQRAFNKYGESSFVFEVLIICDKQNLIMFEQMCIDGLNPEYNQNLCANSPLGRVLSEDTKRKIGLANMGHIPINKGLPRSDSTKQKISEALSNKKRSPLSNEHKKKLSESSKHICKTHRGLVSPSGEKFKEIVNLKKFSNEHGLTYTGIWKVVKGIRNQYKGWRLLT